ALQLAEHLARHPAVERVFHPGLNDHPGHALAARQMRGFGAMLSFTLRGGEAAAMRTVANLKLFTRATSLGSVESLIEHRASMEGPETLTPRNLVRVSVGLEHVDDLIADLDQALTA
ncbi:MAG TPA: PLP-dependent transferase, partial [Gammaproteobacteria bacterium]|nr:PLP-dependent transferase [Gammaproteobacteria bacterium]